MSLPGMENLLDHFAPGWNKYLLNGKEFDQIFQIENIPLSWLYDRQFSLHTIPSSLKTKNLLQDYTAGKLIIFNPPLHYRTKIIRKLFWANEKAKAALSHKTISPDSAKVLLLTYPEHINPKTGEIYAMVGSKDYFAEDEDGKVNVTLAKRQPGSSIKPLNYALALRDEKITAATALTDVPTCFSVVGQPLYCPSNYDNTFHGLVQARFALGNSYNLPAVRVLALNGVENFVEFAKEMGLATLTDPANYGLSLTLGGGEVRPYDMATAFGVLANGGVKQPLISILKVEDWKGKVYEEVDSGKIELSGERVLSPDVAFIVSHILHDNNARSQAFGETSFLNVRGHPEVSVKTGTTNDRRDNWTVGYTKYATVIVWVGNNDYTPMGGAVSGVSGASPIWNRIMREVLDKAEDGLYDEDEEGHAWPSQTEGVVGANICTTTGYLPTGDEANPGCPTRFEYFLRGTIPSKTDTGERQDIPIDKTTGQMAPADFPPELIETQNHPIYTDPLGTLYCLDCPIASASATIRYPLR